MNTENAVINILNESLQHELGAINQYWLHSRFLRDWGFTKLAAKERAESQEEVGHADKLIDRIIFLGGFPNVQTIAPLRIGRNLNEVLKCDLKGERDARALYSRARDICHAAKDYVSMCLFEKLIEDEERHTDFLETQLGLIARVGIENYGQLQACSADQSKD